MQIRMIVFPMLTTFAGTLPKAKSANQSVVLLRRSS